MKPWTATLEEYRVLYEEDDSDEASSHWPSSRALGSHYRIHSSDRFRHMADAQ